MKYALHDLIVIVYVCGCYSNNTNNIKILFPYVCVMCVCVCVPLLSDSLCFSKSEWVGDFTANISHELLAILFYPEMWLLV